jgi:two-component system sensor kinase FixL
VLFNLIRNAIEAMQDTALRLLLISTRQVEEETVEVSVTDTGPGIAPEITAQLFQPFKTTKPHGMGVGLSISRTIVEAHRGRLWAEPNPDGGTVFRLTLKTTVGLEGVEDGD